MNPIWDGIERRKTLRAKAEAMVASVSPESLKSQPTEVLLHELLVHKIELEMQNEELWNAHNALQEARDRYLDLYEFAPVGYITIDHEDRIHEINLTGASLLGDNRSELVGTRFSHCVSPQSSDDWFRLFSDIMTSTQTGTRAIGLQMTRRNGSQFPAHLDCLRRVPMDGSPLLRVTVTDISPDGYTQKK